MPDIYFKLKELLDSSDFTMAEVAILVGRDPGIATRFLRIVNSPLNRRVSKVETISHAVSLLGVNQIHDIVLSVSVAKAFEGMQSSVMNMKKFWQQSFYCAVMTKILAEECDVMKSDRLFVAGLLHDIGHLLMYTAIPKESQRAILTAEESDRPLYQVEREQLGFDYAKVGGYLMKQWDLPKSFQAITWFHPEPGDAKQFSFEVALLHLSSLLVRSALKEGVLGEGAFAVDPTVWKTTNLTEEQCLDLRKVASDQFSEVANSLSF